MAENSGIIVVTGGIGFIGNNLVRRLNEMGHTNIVVVDELDNSEKWKNLDGLSIEDYWDKRDFLSLLNGDCASFKTSLLAFVKAVFHLGACSSTTETDSSYLMENNYRYTRRLCEWCLERGVRFITASSAATYGDGRLGYSDFDSKISAYHPLNMYGMSKHLFDRWAINHGIYRKIVGLKFFNVYGPHECHKGDMRSVVWKAFQQIRAEGRVELFSSYHPDYKDGEFLRDFVYVEDAVKVMLYFWQHPELNGLFNCGTGKARSWNDLAKAVFAAMGRETDIVYKEMPENLRPKYQYFTQANLTKLRGCGYGEEFISLEEGVAKYVAWLKQIYPDPHDATLEVAGCSADGQETVGSSVKLDSGNNSCASAQASGEAKADGREAGLPAETDNSSVNSNSQELREALAAGCDNAQVAVADNASLISSSQEVREAVAVGCDSAQAAVADNSSVNSSSQELREDVAAGCDSAQAAVSDNASLNSTPQEAGESNESACEASQREGDDNVSGQAASEVDQVIPIRQAETVENAATVRRKSIDDEELIKAVLADIAENIIIRKDGLSSLLLQAFYNVDEEQAVRVTEELERRGYVGPLNVLGMHEILV